MRKNCRVCENVLFEQTLLEYKNMPGAAQYMPSQDGLKDDYGVDLNICQCSGCDRLTICDILLDQGLEQYLRLFVQ